MITRAAFFLRGRASRRQADMQDSILHCILVPSRKSYHGAANVACYVAGSGGGSNEMMVLVGLLS